MKIKSGFIFRKIGDDNIIVPIGENLDRYNGLIRLNESARFLCELLKEDTDRESLIAALMKEYGIDEDLASRDVDKFLDILIKREMVEGI